MERFSGENQDFLKSTVFWLQVFFWKDVPWKLDPFGNDVASCSLRSHPWKDDVIRALSLYTYILQFKYITVITVIIYIYIYWDHKTLTNQSSKWCRFSAIKRFCSFPNRDFSGRPGGVFSCPGHNFPMICWELAPNLRRTNNNNHSKTVCSFTTNHRSNQPTTTNIIPFQGSEIQFSI